MKTMRFQAEGAVTKETLRRLLLSRSILVSGETLIVLLAQAFSIRLPLYPMLSIIGLHGLLNLAAYIRARQGNGNALELYFQLAADAAAIAALVYFSGGYANPFISLLLLPLILCAVASPALYVWAMTAWVAALYSLLARYYQPLTLMVDSQRAIDLHLAGMWLNFLFTAVLVAVFVARLTAALRRQDAALALAREKSLRDEHLFALGMQSAAAAHDLATPLSALSVSLKELERDYAGDDELAPTLALMNEQSERMKTVLGRLATTAGAARSATKTSQSVAEWVNALFSNWSLMWPGVTATLGLSNPAPGPDVSNDAILISVVTTLLNNSARASPDAVELVADWDDEKLTLQVLDRGPGMAADLAQPGGWGVGLSLAQAALERYQGELTMEPRDGGGMVVSVFVPLSAMMAGQP